MKASSTENKHRSLSKGRKRLFIVITIFLSLFIVFFVGEVALRIYVYATDKFTPLPPYNYRILDEKIGWINQSNYSHKGMMMDIKNREYPIEVGTTKNGFHTYGNTRAQGKKKIFFIGDSYTQGIEVSNSKAYHNLLKDSLNFECFAYGSAGYGTLQEYMILDKYLPIINPDVVVLQVCSNDFIDNYSELELQSSYKVGKRRPYLNSKGEIIYATPVQGIDRVKEYSLLLHFLGIKIKNLHLKYSGSKNIPPNITEAFISSKGREYALFDSSVKITDKLLKKIKERIPAQTHLVVFVSDPYQPYFDIFEELCKKNNLTLIKEVPFDVKKAEESGFIVKSHDGYHWNEAGHKIVGNALATTLLSILQKNKNE